jgi:hypothetical protein
VGKGLEWRTPPRHALVLGRVALPTVGLASCGSAQLRGSLLSTPAPTVVSGTPAMTPGPQSSFVPMAVTAMRVDHNGAPISPTSHFTVDVPIYVVCRVQGVRPGESHRLTVRWYLQGQQARVPGAYRYATVTHDGSVSFRVTYTSAGVGLVKLYWDEPVADNNDRPNDRFLAQAIAFTVQESST